MSFDQLRAAAQLGRGQLRGVYLDRKQRIRLKAATKRQNAKTRLELARIRAQEAKELADLEASVYQAEIAAQNAAKKAKELRHQAGHYTTGEQFVRVGRNVAKVSGAFVRGLTTSDSAARRRASRKKRK